MQFDLMFGKKVEEEVENGVGEEDKKSNSDDEGFADEDGKYERKKPKKTKEEMDRAASEMDNYYEILGLEERSMAATEKEVTKAYRKKALIYHPDKLKEKQTA